MGRLSGFIITMVAFSVMEIFVDDASCESVLEGLCQPGTFLKNMYCVPKCGPGFYGNSATRKCEKCDPSCKTCLDGDEPKKCSSCNPPLHIRGTSCVASCGDQRSKGPPYLQIRLVDGDGHFEGRVEVYHDNKWGTICDDSWDISDAKVVCRELLLGDAREAVMFGRLGSGLDRQPIWLSKVGCTGNETRLENCDHPSWGKHSCGHFEDAGVRCAGPDTTRECVDKCGEGYFEVKGKKECGVCMASCLTCANSAKNCTSCDKTRFLRGNTCKSYCGDGFYGDPTDRKCKPCDPGCRTCADGTSPSVCTSCHDDRYLNGTQCVVSCAPFHVAQKRRLRLAGNRPTDLEGRVEVFRSGAWVTVCDQTFDFREASVVCQELGLGSAYKAVKRAAYGRGFGRVWTDILNCTGRESSIFDCPLVKRSFSSLCYHGNDVGVKCVGPITKQLSSRCVKTCDPGWFKNDITDVCDTCATQCLECLGTSYRCTKCAALKFLKDNTCVDKCPADQYGHVPTRECRKCDTNICMTCSNGIDDKNCTSCKEPKALKNGKCQDSCAPMFRKNGRCVEDCGVLMYKNPGNYSCLPCPSDCITCEYSDVTRKPACKVCKPPKVYDEVQKECVANCTVGQFAVPVANITGQATPNLKLSNGRDYLEGLLEVYHDGIWGTVCDDGWDAAEINVVCRELSLGKAVTGVSLTHVKKGIGKLWLDDVFCSGNEDSLTKCRHRPWGQSNCQHNEDVALRCTGPGVRTCKSKCPNGFFAKGNTCAQCNSSCSSCYGSADKCNACAPGYYKKNISCVKDCGVGYYLNTTCQRCDKGCADCEISALNCTSCSPPLYRQGTECVRNCTPGYKPSSTPLVRLVNGKTALEGRVEVLHDGKYGTVCDDSWDIVDAQVVCRMLNMGNATKAVIRAGFGSGADQVWLDEVKCLGNESSLIACPHMGWGRENCDHSEDAGVVCQGPDMSRDCLTNCSAGYFINSTDGTCGMCSTNCKRCVGSPENCSVCEDDKFLNRTANTSNCVVHCKSGQFGHPKTKECQKCSATCSDCFGNPRNCTECPPNLYLLGLLCVTNCSKRQNIIDSGVPDIRLVGRNSSSEGRVELLHNGIWGTVCDDNFDINEGTVICRQLKMGKAVAVYSSAKYGQGIGKIWMDDTQCTGNERRLQECKMHHGGFGSNNCGHSEDAGVKCMGPDQSKRCVSECGVGFYDHQGTCNRCLAKCSTCHGKPDVCSSCYPPHFLDFTNCDLECALGKFGNTKTRKCELCDKQCQTCYNGAKNNMCKSCPEGLFLKGLKCVSDCGDMKPVSSMFPAKPKKPLVRLVDGKTKQEGRVEVFYAGRWGTVCDDDWDLKEATIVCKELGFGKALQAPKHSHFGKGSGITWMDNVNCFGYETSLTQCRQVGWGQGNCDPYHREDAGVVCDNTTVEEVSNNYCRRINQGLCSDLKECDTVHRVTCVDLDIFNPGGKQESVCLQCPFGTAGDGKECRGVASKPPEFDQMPPNRTEVKAQDLITLRCRSKPPLVLPTVWDWRKDGKPLLAEDIKSDRITTISGQLLIKSATREDSGNYTCILVNSEGNVTSNMSEVIVKEAPRILGVLSADVNRDDTANLNCIVSSFPASNITWKFKGKNIVASLKYELQDSAYKLRVKNVQFGDSGLYECTLINELGEARANASLTVGLTVEYQDYPPRATVATEGGDVTLKCNVTGVPKPQLVWKKDGELVTNSSKYTVITDVTAKAFTSSLLQIRQVTKQDIAVYSCIAWNRGSVRSKPGRLLLTGPPTIIRPPNDISVLSGANVSFFCRGLGAPTPQLTWLKNSDTIQTSKRILIDPVRGVLKLFLVAVEDVAKYTCVYTNKYGDDRKSAVLIVDGVNPGQLASAAPRQASRKGISTGTIIAIVVILVVIVIVIIGIVLYKYCHARNQSFQFAVHGETLRPSLTTRVKNAIGKKQSPNMYYNHSHEEINFDDSKPFVDHDEL